MDLFTASTPQPQPGARDVKLYHLKHLLKEDAMHVLCTVICSQSKGLIFDITVCMWYCVQSFDPRHIHCYTNLYTEECMSCT